MSLRSAPGYRQVHRDKTTTLSILAATDDQTAFITPKSADHQIFIQRILVSPTTYSAKTWTFKDTADTPIIVGLLSIPASAPTTGGDADMIIDFGDKGFGLTVGKGLTLDVSAAGAAGIIVVEAYEILANTVAAASTN